MTNNEKKMRLEFGTYLKNQRQKSGLTQSEVADSCGLTSPQFISNIERGLCSVPADILVTMADIYKIGKKDLAKRYNKISLVALETEMGIRSTCA